MSVFLKTWGIQLQAELLLACQKGTRSWACILERCEYCIRSKTRSNARWLKIQHFT